MDKLFFDGVVPLVRIVFAVPIMYFCVVAFVRVSGKRTTAQMNGFDWIVTVAMGSLVASGVISRSVPLADALFAILVLLLLQYAVTRVVRRGGMIAGWIKAEPRLLVRDGRFIDEALAAERMTEGEVMSRVRGQGVASLDDVAAVVLETDGQISVIARSAADGRGSFAVLDDVRTTAKSSAGSHDRNGRLSS